MTMNFDNMQNVFDSYKADMEKKAAARQEAEAKRAEDARNAFIRDGMVYSIASSVNGHTAIVSSGFDTENNSVMEPVIDTMENKVKDNRVKPATATLIAIGRVLRSLDENSRKRIVLAIQSTEVRRVAGMIRRATSGEPAQLTDKEIEYIKTNDRIYDDMYMTVANGLTAIIKKTVEAGFKLSVVSNSDLYSFSLAFQPDNAESLHGKTVYFTNGRATIGRQNIRLANYNLNGTHKLVIYKGRLSVERNVSPEKNPATFIAQNLLTIATYAVNDVASHVAENNDSDIDLDIAI